MAAQTEDEWLDRYQAAPAAGRGMVVAAVVHDDIRGRTHISSSAELAAFESRSGRLLWRRTLSRIAPLKITQSRYPRKIRILSTTPAVNQGVVYHCSNAGVVAALDAQTGDIRWLTRYPQVRSVLDNFAGIGHEWRNTTPLIRGNRLYVAPADCKNLLCMDRDTGRVLWSVSHTADSAPERPGGYPEVWRLAGFAADGNLVLTGYDVVLLDPLTGRLVWRARMSSEWMKDGPVQFGGMVLGSGQTPPKGLTPAINGDGEDYWFPYGRVEVQPTLTSDGRMYFNMRSHNGCAGGTMFSEFCLDLNPADRKFLGQRRWFTPGGFILDGGWTPPIVKRPVNEEPEEFRTAMRMPFRRWDVPFEADIAKRHVVVRYDRGKLEKALAGGKSLEAMFGRAELVRKGGDLLGAIGLYEGCKGLLPSEEEDRRRAIDLRLYPLYMELARWGHQARDWGMLEGACRKMGATATSPSQEIRALLAYGELYEKRGQWAEAVQVLQNAVKHYWREPFELSGLETGAGAELSAVAVAGLTNLVGNVAVAHAGVAREVYRGERAALGDYFLSVADVPRDQVGETRSVVAGRLGALVGRAPAGYRAEYQKAAGQQLGAEGLSAEVAERLLWCWPGTEAGRVKVRQLAAVAGAGGARELDRVAGLWRLSDVAEACGLGGELAAEGKAGLEVGAGAAVGLDSGEGWAEAEGQNEDPEVVRRVLTQRGQTGGKESLLFVGGRKKRAYGNRFTVSCWDMRGNRKAWDSQELLLHKEGAEGEEGYEVGFEEVFLYGELALVHGQHDVIALSLDGGKDVDGKGRKTARWHFRVPLGFEIQSAELYGRLLVLCGRGSTVALSAEEGEIVWEEPEKGEYYAGPRVDGEVVYTVRKSPAEVSFRKLCSGRLLGRLSLTGLTTNRKHPVYAGEGGQVNPAAAEAAEGYPVAFGPGVVVVQDGRTYQVVDVGQRQVRWTAAATKLDPAQDPSYRMWVEGGRLVVLKPYYGVLENAVFDLQSGDMLWRRREGGKKVEEKLKAYGEAAQGDSAVGLVLSSMVFVDGVAYGIRYEMGSSGVELVGMDLGTGNEVLSVKQTGYQDPEAVVENSSSRDCVVVRVQDGNRFELWQVDVKKKALARKLVLTGYGRLGEYGDVSAAAQGPHLALWAHELHKFVSGPK
jgi:outer membrane protein assembly factor BamB